MSRQNQFEWQPRQNHDFDSHIERYPNQVRPTKPNNRFGGSKHKNLRSHRRSNRIRPSF